MDLPTFFKEYQGIIAVVSGLLIAILSYNFGKLNSERQRKWKLRDRQFKEAYMSLSVYRQMTEMIEKVEYVHIGVVLSLELWAEENLSEDEVSNKVGDRIDDYFLGVSQLMKLTLDGLEMNTSIIVLGERKLSQLN